MLAAVVMETTYSDTKPPTQTRRLVCIDVDDQDQARRDTGLVDVDFHPATDAEVEEWHLLTSEELDEHDLVRLERLVRGEIVQVGNKRLRDVFHGRSGERQERDLGKAVRLSMLRGKLLAWLSELEEEHEEEVEAA